MDPKVDRRNGDLFLWANLLIYLAAPVFYVGVVQAALCHKLGASATVANLPTAGYFFASFAPVILACVIPHRWERGILVIINVLTAVLVALVACALCLPLSDRERIAMVVSQGLLLGILHSINQVYLMQCLGRGTTEWGRARALKLTFTFGPLAAVAGSAAAQYILGGGISVLHFPKDFALLYLIALPCSAIAAWCCNRFELAPLADEPRFRFFPSMRSGFQRYLQSPQLVLLWFAYALWYCAFLALPNLSLFTKQAMGREPAEVSGLITVVQFGSKALAGFGMGVLYHRQGVRAPLIATVFFLGLASLWAWLVPGYFFLAAFAFVGAGQLGGVYFPNVLLSWSPAKTATQDLAVLGLAKLAASPAPAVYGLLTDHWGFASSFGLGIALAAIALVLVLRLPVPSSRQIANAAIPRDASA